MPNPRLVKASHRTTVAALDSEMLKYGAELALQKASRVQTTFQAQEPVELLLKLKGQNAQVRYSLEISLLTR